MALAIERAIEARSGKEKERAARWAAAWGLLCGIKTNRVHLRASEIKPHFDDHFWRSFAQIAIPSMPAMKVDDSDGMCEMNADMHQHIPAPSNFDSGSQA